MARFLLEFGLSFRGHDESEFSQNKGIFLGLLEWLRIILPDMNNVILKHAPKNAMMTSLKIQKDIVSSCAQEIMKAIIDDLDGDFFEILVDESKGISHHEQMALALSHMQGKMNGLKALILQETPSAYCIHYFAHQLQLTFVVVANFFLLMDNFFAIIANVLNVVGSSSKHRDQLRDHQAERLEQLLESGEVQSGKSLNKNEGFKDQRKEQDIVNAMIFLDITKKRLQLLRDDGWESLMNEVSLLCDKHEILVPKMDEFYIPRKSKRKSCSVTYTHHLHVELFYVIIDLQLQELNSRFDVVSGNLLLGMTSLNSVNAFANFDKEKIMILAKHYPDEFGEPKL
ncbi:hypothetical protein H5410_052005 [Solanum commersonii]|uniref:DUF4371 domain-containing protein n=1 Tax=Solanum commersonii TaxID=4109 RepID=A0A9J5X063_SOLCO|nr:hypothetical protein H5410_052005 [Solanum commersonii]